MLRKEEEKEKSLDMKYVYKTQSGSGMIWFFKYKPFRAPKIARKLEVSLVCMLYFDLNTHTQILIFSVQLLFSKLLTRASFDSVKYLEFKV